MDVRALPLLLLFALTSTASAQAPTGFSADCPFSHRAADDPIVHPGDPGASHMHDFYGNRSTDSNSSEETLAQRGTTCRPRADRSAYWTPRLKHRGRSVRPRRARFYYVVVNGDPASVRPLPTGLRIIAGNPHGEGTERSPRFAWTCTGSTVLDAARIPRCRKGSRLTLKLRFPDCWDGERLDSADHQSHMAYGTRGACPASHPVAVPQLRFEIRYATRGGRRTTLSSGPTWTTHGDLLNAWEPGDFERRLRDCVAARTCVGSQSDAY